MGRKEDNIKIKSIIRTLLLTSNRKWTANELASYIETNGFKISIHLNKHTIHNIIKMDKRQKGILSNIEYEMVKNTKHYYLKHK